MKNESQIKDTAMRANIKRVIGRLLFISILVVLCLFGAAGTVFWINGWSYMTPYMLMLIVLV